MISTQVALSGAGGRVGDLARRAVVARATDVALEAAGPAGVKEAKTRQRHREYSGDYRKKKKAKVEGLVQDEARLLEQGAFFLEWLGRGGEQLVLTLGLGDDEDDEDDEAGENIDRDDIRKDEEALKALRKARARGDDVDAALIRRMSGALSAKRGRARKKAKLKKDQRRVKALTGRVAELEEECYLGDVLSLI